MYSKKSESYSNIPILQYSITVKRSEFLFGILRIPLDALAVMAALLLSYRLREANVDLIPRVQLLDPAQTLPPIDIYLQEFVVPSLMAFLFLAAIFSLYALRTTRSAWSEVGRIITAGLLWLVVIIGWYFLVRKQLFYSRILLLHSTFFIIFFVLMGRVAVVLLQRAFLRCGIGVRLVVSIGSMPIAKNAEITLLEDMRYQYVGHISDLEALRRLGKRHHIDLVIQTDANPKSDDTIAIIDECRSQHYGYAYLPPVLSDVPHLLRVEKLGLIPMMRFQPTPLDGWGHILKRVFDLIVSLILLVLLLPVFIVIGLIIFLDNGWPIFYSSKRVGVQGRGFLHMWKFRTMCVDADAKKEALTKDNQRTDGPLFKINNDPRITRIGKALRRFDIDELPQLLNVFLGHMSLVGPRPHLPEEVEKYHANQRRVFAVKPGITGLAQISGRSDLKFDDEVRYDLQYIEEWSPLLDLWILWRTIFVILSRKGEG